MIGKNMKYHHPAIATGDYNWDYELFRFLPAYLKANDKKQRDEILIKWINKYGRIPKCKTCQATPDSAYIKPDLSWIENGDTSLKLKDILNKVYLNRNQKGNYYVNADWRVVGYPLFTNERAYEKIDFPDTGFRLLALYRYWNIIHYFFPYKYLTDKDWNSVLREYIPYFLLTTNEQEYRLTVTRLIAEICDSHAILFEKRLVNSESTGNPNNPEELTFQYTRVINKKEQDTYRGKLVVIVNEYTQSNSEFKAMAYRAGDNTTIFDFIESKISVSRNVP